MTLVRSSPAEALAAALGSLASRLEHINSSVVVLNGDTQRSYDLVKLALSTLTDLGLVSDGGGQAAASATAGSVSQALDAVHGQLQELNATLVDTSARVLQLRDAVVGPQEQLDQAPDATPARQALADLAAQLAAFAPPVQAVGDALRAHLRRPDAGVELTRVAGRWRDGAAAPGRP